MPQWKVWFTTIAVCCGHAFLVSGQSTPNWQRYNQATVGIDLQASASLSFSPRTNLWVTHVGQGAITRLDGYGPQPFNAPMDGDFRVYESETRQLWALHPLGLQSSDGTTWSRYVIGKVRREMQSVAVRLVRQIPLLPAEHNNVLVLLSDQLFKYDAIQDQSITLLERDGLNLGNFIDLIPAAGGGIWITAEAGIVRVPTPLRKINSQSPSLPYSVPAGLNVQQLRDPFEYRGGLAMLGIEMETSKKFLVRFVDGEWTKTELPNKNFRRCWITPDGRYWGLTVKELYQWTELHPEPVRMEFEPDQYSDVAMDPMGAFFISGPGGVWRYASAAWRPPVELAGDSHRVEAFAETSTNGLWFVDGNRLVQVNDGEWTYHEIGGWSGEAGQQITGLGALPSSDIVLVSADRVGVFDVGSGRVRVADNGGRTGMKLLGTMGSNLVLTDSTRELITFDGADWNPTGLGIPDEDIGEWTACIQANNGDFWLGGTAGVARNNEGMWSFYRNTDSALALAEFGDQAIWIGGTNRVRYFSGQGFAELDYFKHDRNGLQVVDRVNTLHRGQGGEKWIAAANGLWKEFGNEFGNTWLRFGSEEGLPRNLLAFHETATGERWVGSEQGAYKYFPEADREPPRTFLVEVPASPQVSQLELVSFTFSGQDKWHASRDEGLLFSWRFDDGKWSAFSDQRRVSRNGSSFSEGTHTFEVRSMDVYQNVDFIMAAAKFDIIVPWFQDTRLRGITALAGLAVLIFAGLAVNRHLRLQRSYTEIERIVEERTHQLKLANQELAHSEKMRSLGTLAAGVAHDFNSILSIIRGSVQIIEANPDNREKIQTRVDRIKSMVEQGSTLVKSMLGFSRADDAGLALHGVDDVVEDAVELLGDRLPDEILISVDASAGLPPVRGNRELLQQIIVNLVLNAVDAMDGKGTLVLRCHRVHNLPEHWVLPPAGAADFVIVTVEDNGCGISPENLSRIFEPFFTTKAFSTRHGTGLGLSMVYEFCKELGYGLNVRSELYRGTSFNIVIPVLEKEEQKSPAL